MAHPMAIGGWTVVDRLGDPGSFADVYRVRGDDRDLALKLCQRAGSIDRARMDMEVSALTALASPRSGGYGGPGTGSPVPRQGDGSADAAGSDSSLFPWLIETGDFDGRMYIVMSLAPGRPLKKLVEEADSRGAVFGDIEAMRILRRLLHALGEVHRRGLVHRDVKEANVLYDAETGTVTLIDFGFCKPAGMTETITDGSFIQAGAARFSPPGKLAHPARAEPIDDVFAVGVIGYRLMTGEYPWEAGPRQDVSALRRAQQQGQLIPVQGRNSRVLRAASDVVAELLELDDGQRPTAARAYQAVERFLAGVESQQPGARISRAARLRYPQKIRDALYGDVRMTTDEWRVLDSVEIQRLRSLKQLGLTDLVYPGATHSRLSHAIGCLARVEQMLVAIEQREGQVINDDIRRTARLFALTHDITQIPFGNTIEDELGYFERHDRNRPRALRMLGEDTELGAVLRDIDMGPTTLAHLTPGEEAARQPVVSQLVTGPVGAVVLDYVNRDATFCGLDDRIDSAIFRQLYLLKEEAQLGSVVGDKYGLRVDREYAVESLLRTRYALFMKVYTNRSKAAASALLGRALLAAIYHQDGHPPLAEQDLERHNDETLLDYLRRHPDPAVNGPARQLLRRHLPRAVYRGVLLTSTDPAERERQERKLGALNTHPVFSREWRRAVEATIAAATGVAPEHVIVHCPAKPPGYRLVEHWVSQSEDDTSPTPQALGELERKHLFLWELWVFVDPSLSQVQRAAVARVSQPKCGGMPNLISKPRQEDR